MSTVYIRILLYILSTPTEREAHIDKFALQMEWLTRNGCFLLGDSMATAVLTGYAAHYRPGDL